jgi:hypothetical protein
VPTFFNRSNYFGVFISSIDEPGKNNEFVVIKVRRRTVFAFLITLLLHGIVLFGLHPKKITNGSSIARSLPQPISVRLAELPAKKPLAQKEPKLPQPTVIAVDENSPISIPQNTPPAPAPIAAEKNAPKDLMSFINSKRQRNQALEDYAASVNASARALSGEAQRDENIRRNLQQPGTSGIFEIKYRSTNKAQFSFKGWKNIYSTPQLEIIDVEAGADGNVESVIVKKMIEIIRREYSGDFNWESQRLGRIIVLSARLNDNSGLEEFLKREFFTAEKY